MKKLLPKFLILLVLIGIFIGFHTTLVNAAVPDDSWVIDKEVTFVGKNAARSGLLLDWTLQDYKWASVSAGVQNPLIPFWITIRNIVYALFILFVIVTAFILVTTRGRSLSAKRFLPRFVVVILLVTFSFALLQFLYQITDGIQGFFLRSSTTVACPPECISQKDLFYWSWDYKDFIGLRKIGEANNESAYISLILTKLSALTYYVMIGILIVRKIILWFFIIVSPIFPLLLLYYPVRNTAKIWIGEFFRWLFYAPLFAVFLAGLVSLWKQNIPLRFLSSGGETVYPTAVNILLAGPQQSAAFNNSVNLTDTYALYLVALIMLWVVIILPFILLQIFLDYLSKLSLNESPGWSQIVTMINKKFPPSPPPIAPIPPGPATTGLARSLPFRNRFKVPQTTGMAKSIPTTTSVPASTPTSVPASIPTQVVRKESLKNHDEILKLANLAVPTMRDIARFESARLQKDTQQIQEISKIRENLEKIASPQSISSSVDRERYSQIRDSLIKERDLGSPMAASILKAAESMSATQSKESNTLREVLRNIAKPELVKSLEKEKYVEIRERIEKESQKGNTIASTILSAVNNVSQSTSSSTATDTTSIREVVKQLSAPGLIANSSDRASITSLKDQLVKEEKTGNTVAKNVLATAEKISSSTTSQAEKDQQITKLREVLLQEANKGNDLAISVLSVLKKEESGEDIQKVKERLEKAKANGDSLATTILALLATQATTDTAATQQAATKASIPTSNRIQQVSLDDYEAVKDMWVENYQNLDVPQNLEGEQTRKQWIEDDMGQIEDTINLLSSANAEEVEKGMEQVSNILPFLLIGGFSQSEITAYLKAKLEAGKEALKIVEVTQSEDDTLLEVKRSQKAESKTMTTSTHAAMPIANSTEAYSEKPSSELSPTIINPQITINITGSPENQKIMELTNITIPKMLEIAKYEAELKSGSANSEAKSILNNVSNLANPNAITDPQKKAQINSLRELLIKESQNGNPLAESILSAAGVVDKEKAGIDKGEVGSIIKLLKELFDPTLVKNPTDREKYIDLKKKVEEKASTGELLASSIMQVLKRMTQDYVFALHALFEDLKNPDNIKDLARKEKIKAIKETLTQEQKLGNSMANDLLSALNKPLTMESILPIKLALIQEKEIGNISILQILSEFPAVPAIDIVSAQNIKKLLDAGVAQKESLAVYIQTFLLKREDIKDDSILLPDSNKLQAVSLDDYESVKSLWIENYNNSENVKEELDKDQADVTEAINLLASAEKIKKEQGMEKVSTILPFLLIGGFSQAEVVSYLKAKLEAIKTVRQELSKEDTKLDITQSKPKPQNTQTQVLSRETESDSTDK